MRRRPQQREVSFCLCSAIGFIDTVRMKTFLCFLFCSISLSGLPAQAMSKAELAQRINQARQRWDYASLVPLCTEALQTGMGNRALVYDTRGFANYMLKHLSAALADTSEALKLNPRMADAYAIRAYAIRADVYLDLNKFDLSRRDAEEAIRLDPTGRGGYRPRADMEYEEHDYSAALRDYDHVLRVDPHDAWTLGGRGNAYLAMHEPKKAADDYWASLRLMPRNSFDLLGSGGGGRTRGTLRQGGGEVD